jgi:hypothetical protein
VLIDLKKVYHRFKAAVDHSDLRSLIVANISIILFFLVGFVVIVVLALCALFYSTDAH